jgi:hypothetical protein
MGEVNKYLMNYHDQNPLEQGVNFSFLKMGIQKSWKHAYEAYVLGLRSSPTPAMLRGTLIHCLALEPEEFDNRYVVAPEINRRTKAGKAEWQELVEYAGNRAVVNQDDYLEAVDCQMALQEHPWFGLRLSRDGAETEKELHAVIDDVKVRGKLDLLVDNCVVDLKTTSDASPDSFRRSIHRYMYQAQLAFYADLAGAEKAYIVAIETTGTHQVAVYELGEDTLNEGRAIYRAGLSKYQECMKLYSTLGSAAFQSYPLQPVVI